MSTILECLEPVVGLSRNTDIEGYEEEYSDSLSGLFIDELQGLNLVNTCGVDVWNLLDRSRENAIKTLRSDLSQEATKWIQPKRGTFSGTIGTIQFNKLESTSTYFGARIFTNLTGVKNLITGITYLPTATGDQALYIFDDYDLIHTIAITGCVAGKQKRVTFDYELTAGNTYFLIQGSSAYRSKLTCCGTPWCFNTEKPCYNITKLHWSRWIMAAGITGTDINSRETWTRKNQFYSMAIHASFYCNIDSLICSEFSDFEGNETDRAIAHALQYKSGELFLNSIMDSGEINRFTLLGNEAMNFNRETYANRYKVMIEYAAANLDLNRTDCYSCKTQSKLVRI
jgi:hypothetical protein